MAASEKSKSGEGDQEKSKQGNTQQKQGQKNQQAQGQQQQGKQDQQNQGQKKDVGWPEWITFGIGLALILGVVGLQIYLHVQGEAGPPRIVAEPKLNDIYQEGDDFYLPVEILNERGETAEDVNVQVSLEDINSKAETISLVVEFLSPEEVSKAVIVFKTNPRQGRLTYLVTFEYP